jgi:two-component system chemotaxis response regulator CheY
MRVLVVDDAAVMRAIVAVVLERHGFEVAGEAASAAEALAQYRALRPDVVTLDVALPGIDGGTAVHEILAVDQGARIVVCGSSDQRSLIDAALAAGALGYIAKPVQPEAAAEALRRAFASPEDVQRATPNNGT